LFSFTRQFLAFLF